MSSPEGRWWSVRAGEYVLGTLRGKDLELFERILAHDTAMQAEVDRWERLLGPLHETTRPVAPAEHVWSRVLGHLHDSEKDLSGETASPQIASTDTNDEARPLGTGAPTSLAVAARAREESGNASAADRGRFWQRVAGLATAACVVLGVTLGLQLHRQSVAPLLEVDGLAVVLSDADGEPYFLVETDYANQKVRVTALTPPGLEEERNFQLWQALPDRSSVRPVALLPREPGRTRVFDVSSLIEGSDLFGVSLEPDGAPTDDGPTGPVVAHGDFLITNGE